MSIAYVAKLDDKGPLKRAVWYTITQIASLLPFYSPVAYRDPESCDMINLLIRLLIDALNEYAYNAEIAGIQYKVMNNIYGFMVIAPQCDNSELLSDSKC